MKRYRVKLTRPYYRIIIYVELSANSMNEARVKGKEFIEKAYGRNEIGYIHYVISSVQRIHVNKKKDLKCF